MAPTIQETAPVNPLLDDDELVEEEFDGDEDEESFIEEIIVDSGDEIEEEELIDDEEEIIEEIEEQRDEEIVDESSSSEGSGTGTYMDDSTAPPMSLSSDAPLYDGTPMTSSFRKDREAILQLNNAAVSEGARKAMEEELQREKAIKRQAARDALALERLQQEEEFIRRQADYNEFESEEDVEEKEQRKQQETAHKRLEEEIRKVDQVLLKKRQEITLETQTKEREKRRKALAELRRQAAREELARNNLELKAAKASRIDTGISPKGTAIMSHSRKSSTIEDQLAGLKVMKISNEMTSHGQKSNMEKDKPSIEATTPWAMKLEKTQMDTSMTPVLGLQTKATQKQHEEDKPVEDTSKSMEKQSKSLSEVTQNHQSQSPIKLRISPKVSPVEKEKSPNNNGTLTSPVKSPSYMKREVDPEPIPSMFRASFSKLSEEVLPSTNEGTSNGDGGTRKNDPRIYSPAPKERNAESSGSVPSMFRASFSKLSNEDVPSKEMVSPSRKSAPEVRSPAYLKKTVDTESIPSMFRSSFSQLPSQDLPAKSPLRKSAPQLQSPVYMKKNASQESVPSMFRSSLSKSSGGVALPDGDPKKSTHVARPSFKPSAIKRVVRSSFVPKDEPSSFQGSDEKGTSTRATIDKFYPLTDLQQKKVQGIDDSRREQYLSPDDFVASFKMSKEEFTKLPKWKRDQAKRNLNLF